MTTDSSAVYVYVESDITVYYTSVYTIIRTYIYTYVRARVSRIIPCTTWLRDAYLRARVCVPEKNGSFQ